MDWSTHYPAYCVPPGEEPETDLQKAGKCVEFADIGCGYGGLLGMRVRERLVRFGRIC